MNECGCFTQTKEKSSSFLTKLAVLMDPIVSASIIEIEFVTCGITMQSRPLR